MAITFGLLEAGGSDSNAGASDDPYQTGSVAMVANRTIVVAFVSGDSGTEQVPDSVASANVAFVNETSLNAGNGSRFLSFWRATPASSFTEAIDIILPDDAFRSAWYVIEVLGSAGTSGNNGSDAFGNKATNTASNNTGPLTTAFVISAGNGGLGFTSLSLNNETFDAIDGVWAEQTTATAPTEAQCLGAAWKSTAADDYVSDWTNQATAVNTCGVEIVIAAVGGANPHNPLGHPLAGPLAGPVAA